MDTMDTRVINLMDLFYYVLSKWRVLLVGALLGAVLLGGFGFLRARRAGDGADAHEESRAAYEAELEKLQLRIESLESVLERRAYIKEQSVMLQMDPYRVYEAVISYYADSHGGNPAAYINAYGDAVRALDLDSLFSSESMPDAMADNPVSDSEGTLSGEKSVLSEKSLLTLLPDPENGTLTVTVQADSRAHLDRIVDAVEAAVAETKTVLDGSVGAHTLHLLHRAARQTVDLDYAALGERFDAYTYELMQNLADASNELTTLDEPGGGNGGKAVSKAVKYGAVGFIAGLLIAAGLAAFRAIVKNRIISAEEIKNRYQLPVLGTVWTGDKKPCAPDARIAAKLGMPYADTKSAAAYIAAAKKLFLKDGQTLLLGSDAEAAALAERLKAQDAASVYHAAGDPTCRADAVAQLSSATAVICVEKWSKLYHRALKNKLSVILQAVPPEQVAVIITR
ncbi:MAG: hypothetical protein IJT78_00770 [Oscillospiraceae bacterium]|nr:hypothetical protein [Oscillospiraceae bacterium]